MGKLIKFKGKQTKEGENMCEALSKIRGMTAEELLEKYGDNTKVPVDLKELLENIGISSFPMDFSKVEKEIGAQQGDVLGLLFAKDEKAAIFFKAGDSLKRRRFTIAHELAHCCLHLEDSATPHIELRQDAEAEQKNERERAADIFAGKLLIPLHLLAREYKKMKLPNSKDLANIFGVSIKVMEARLDYLNVSYYNRDGKAVVYGDE